ncbi:MAG: DUF2283 domain-containing protein [Anaerolineae bacterium]|nr:DUF2283 domain-containing protein [Anaerolineae bacterium]
MDIAYSVNNVPIRLTVGTTHRLWLDYDHEADVLYISLERPQKATASKMRDDGILLRYRGRKLVGVTIFEASKREGLSAKR